MTDVRIGLLGPTVVQVRGETVEIGGRRERTLLALLALAGGSPVAPDRIAEELWAGTPPASAQSSLQTFVSRLRALLDPERKGLIPLSAAGYRLQLEPGRIDVFRFEALAEQGRRALAEGRVDDAHGLLAEALGLWHGQALADFADEEFARIAAGRFEALRLDAVEDQFEAALTLGYHGALVPELERLIEEHPFRERLRGQLALALYRSGRQADALAALREARAALDEIGLEPSAALRTLESRILNQDPELDPPAAAVEGPPPPLPSGSPAGASDFVGRARELAVVEQALEQALAGHGRILLLEGEPGIGKSRLAIEAARLGGERTAVLFGPCYEGERAPSLWPWVAIVREALEHLGADGGAALEALPELRSLLPEEGPTEPEQRVPADTRASFTLYDAVVGLLQRLGERRPLVVILDDLQWADSATLQLLELLALRTVSLPLLLVGTLREDGLDERADLGRALATVSRHPWTTRLALEGLPYEAVSQLVQSTVGEEAPSVVSVVFSRSGGNPFFATELVRLLESEGDLASRRVYSGIPLGVRDVVRRRLSALPEATRDLLPLASVIGHTFELGLLAAAAGIDRDACVEALEPALAARVVVPIEGRRRRSLFAFSHALVSETVVDDLSPIRSGTLHGRVAHALLELRGDEEDWAEETADHVRLAGTAVDAGLAVAALRRGAAIAYGRFAFDRAERLWTALVEALDDLPPGPERDRLELEALLRLLPLILAYRGSADARVTGLFERTLALAERSGEVLALVQMLLFKSISTNHLHQRDETERLIRRALSAAEAAGDPLALGHANLVLAMDHFWVGRITESRWRFRAAIGAWEPVAAEHPRDEFPTFSLYPESLFYARAAFIEAWAGDPEGQAHGLVRHVLVAADADGGPLARQISRYSACLVELAMRDYAACRRFCEEGLDVPPEQRSPTYSALLRIVLAWARAMEGDCAGQAEEIDDAFREFRTVDVDTFRRSQLCLRAEVELRCGRPADALATVEPLLADEDDPDEIYFLPWLMRIKAEALVATDPRSRPDAEALLDRARRLAVEQGSGLLEREAQAALARLS